MAVSVIVSNLNGARFLPKLLETLENQRDIKVEIIVVDRESKDESHEILRRHPGLKVVSEPSLTGLVSGYARGVKEAAHEHLFFCNEDMWFDLDCLIQLERQINLPARVASADPWQWTYTGDRWLHGATRFKNARWAINGVHPFHHFDFMVEAQDGDLTPLACAGAFMIHRQVYDSVGGWDTSFFLDNEDTDFFIRAWQQGWNCATVPSAKVYHAVGMSNIQETGSQTPAKIGRRRYISNRLGKSVIVWKYFSFLQLWMAPAIFLVMFANNLLKGRFELVRWDLDVLSLFLKRLPLIQKYRQTNHEQNRRKPGEYFFADRAFQRQDS